MNVFEEYKRKKRTPDEAVRVVESGDWVEYTMGHGIPPALDRALAARKGEVCDVNIRGMLVLRPLQVVEVDPENESFTYNSWHFSGIERRYYDKGAIFYNPLLYRNKPLHYRTTIDVDVAMVAVAPMDKHGYFNFSLQNSATSAMIEKAKTVIVEVNEKLPITLGGREEAVHISDVDFVVEGDHLDLPEFPRSPVTEVDKVVARLIVDELVDGSTIQFGIGGMPDTVGRLLCESDLKDLGMHTEMLVDAYLDLFLAGKLTNRRKNIDKGKGVWTFCVGTKALYEWADRNPGLASYPVDYTNSPQIAAANDNLVAINNCVEVDLFGQVNSESSGLRQISGTGGQLDFCTSAYLSRGGKAFVCLSSTYTDKKTGEVRSRIVPTLPPGSAVTDPRSQTPYLVTEYGVANLSGRSMWERTERIIEIAHPSFRDELIREAGRMKIWRRSCKR
jgi:butyryl-CoA:acetate CoA-transferase